MVLERADLKRSVRPDMHICMAAIYVPVLQKGRLLPGNSSIPAKQQAVKQ